MLKNPDKQEGRRIGGQPAKPRKFYYFFVVPFRPSFLEIPILPALLRSLWNTQHVDGQRETRAPPPDGDSHLVPCLSSEFFIFRFDLSPKFFYFFFGVRRSADFFWRNFAVLLKKFLFFVESMSSPLFFVVIWVYKGKTHYGKFTSRSSCTRVIVRVFLLFFL